MTEIRVTPDMAAAILGRTLDQVRHDVRSERLVGHHVGHRLLVCPFGALALLIESDRVAGRLAKIRERRQGRPRARTDEPDALAGRMRTTGDWLPLAIAAAIVGKSIGWFGRFARVKGIRYKTHAPQRHYHPMDTLAALLELEDLPKNRASRYDDSAGPGTVYGRLVEIRAAKTSKPLGLVAARCRRDIAILAQAMRDFSSISLQPPDLKTYVAKVGPIRDTKPSLF